MELTCRGKAGRIRTDTSFKKPERYTIAYNANGFLTGVTDALGHATHVTTLDGRGDPTTIVDGNGITTTLTYDMDGHLTGATINPGFSQSVYSAT